MNQSEESTPVLNREQAPADVDGATSSSSEGEHLQAAGESTRTTRDNNPTDSSFLPRLSRFLPLDYADEAHCFEKVSLDEAPKSCDLCNQSCSAGLRKKGLQCKECGMFIGPGHDKCHAQAMLTVCEQTVQTEKEAAMDDVAERSSITEESKRAVSGTEYEDDSKSNDELQGKTVQPFSLRNLLHRRSVYDVAHKFILHSYGSPTYCAVCQGLLAGLWSQGLQCEVCGLNIHKGEGIDEHDDCRLEALLWPCAGKKIEEDQVLTLREAMHLSPNFIKDVTDQMGKDLHSHAKDIVVGAGVVEERSKKLRRLRTQVLDAVEVLDAWEERGELYCIFLLFRLKFIFSVVVMVAGIVIFNFALCPKFGFRFRDTYVWHFAFMHLLTVFCSIHMCLVIAVLTNRFGAYLFMRKAFILDRFLRDIFDIDAEKDLGISVADAARRIRMWSDRALISAVSSFLLAFLLWTVKQPTFDELTRGLNAKSLNTEQGEL